MENLPFLGFGNQLKRIREDAKESIAEVSGAVEIDIKSLASIEAGKTKPDEDLLLLLISHFALKEDEALKLWEMAGFSQDQTGITSLVADDKGIAQTAFVSLNDARIIYTDMVHINANRYGLVINFLQGLGANNQPMTISRIGMSHEHAQSLIKVLQKSLKLSGQPKQSKTPKSKI